MAFKSAEADVRVPKPRIWLRTNRRRWTSLMVMGALTGAFSLYALGADAPVTSTASSLDETRLALSKWIETQQIIAKERKEWQQGKEVLTGRIEMMEKEISELQSQIKASETQVQEANAKRADLQKQDDELKAVQTQLKDAAGDLETDVRRLYKQLPDPLQEKMAIPLYSRIPPDPASAKNSLAERYQTVLGILNEVNKANGDITVDLETREATQVNVIYIGLARAYYAGGKVAGVSWPTPDGWKSESMNAISDDVIKTLEIIQGKQTPAFVALPMKIK